MHVNEMAGYLEFYTVIAGLLSVNYKWLWKTLFIYLCIALLLPPSKSHHDECLCILCNGQCLYILGIVFLYCLPIIALNNRLNLF